MKNIILKASAWLTAMSYPVGFMTYQAHPATTVATVMIASAYLAVFTFVNRI